MPTLYVSILLEQPTDGDVVFIRRFTRDPPVRATWSASAAQFTLFLDPQITVVGTPQAGIFTPLYAANFVGSGHPAWYHLSGGIYSSFVNAAPGLWQMIMLDAATWDWKAPTVPWSGATITQTVFAADGAPPFAAPTSMSLSGATPYPLIIPASLVQAWRPL